MLGGGDADADEDEDEDEDADADADEDEDEDEELAASEAAAVCGIVSRLAPSKLSLPLKMHVGKAPTERALSA